MGYHYQFRNDWFKLIALFNVPGTTVVLGKETNKKPNT